MKKIIALVALVAAFAVAALVLSSHNAEWPGVDDSVVKKFAEKAGRPPVDPYINIAQGDLELFFFLLAGVVGGFTAGYYYRQLFSTATSVGDRSESV
ncbi:MAG: hypothetical protein ACP5M0_02545 [Desulfomonilaceae bacterium]